MNKRPVKNFTLPLIQPRSYQIGPFVAYKRGIRKFAIIAHRRSGKDVLSLNFMIVRAFERVGSYFFLYPTYRQGKQILWYGVDREGFKFLDYIPPELIRNTNKSDLRVELVNGSSIQIIGTDNVDRVVGTNPVGLVFSEAALHEPFALDFMRPILIENQGWLYLQGTPRGRTNWFTKIYLHAKDDPSWYAALLPADKTFRDAPGEDGSPVVTKAEIDALIAEGRDPDIIKQEYYCDLSGLTNGTLYASLVEKAITDNRVCSVPWNPRLPVYTAYDLGYSDHTSIVFWQRDNGFINIIDFLERRGEGLAYYAGEIKAKGYDIACHYFPHDAEAHDVGSGKSRLEFAREHGLNPQRLTPNVGVENGIDTLRSIFPLLRFDRDRCDHLLKCLTHYHRKYNPKRQEFEKAPYHDFSADACDAMRYMSLVYDFDDPSRMTPTTCTGMDEPIFDNPSDDSEPRRNALGGFRSQERSYSLERVEQVDPVTGRTQIFYK
jgi:phage terminase large subunit